MQIHRAKTPDDWQIATTLVREYVDSLAKESVDLSFQQIDLELSALSTVYENRFFIALEEIGNDQGYVARPLGCVGLKPFFHKDWQGAIELKRLYIKPRARGRGLGAALVNRAIGHAKSLGYTNLLLDCLPAMKAAQALYVSMGFEDISTYTINPIIGTRFMKLNLQST